MNKPMKVLNYISELELHLVDQRFTKVLDLKSFLDFLETMCCFHLHTCLHHLLSHSQIFISIFLDIKMLHKTEKVQLRETLY